MNLAANYEDIFPTSNGGNFYFTISGTGNIFHCCKNLVIFAQSFMQYRYRYRHDLIESFDFNLYRYPFWGKFLKTNLLCFQLK